MLYLLVLNIGECINQVHLNRDPSLEKLSVNDHYSDVVDTLEKIMSN